MIGTVLAGFEIIDQIGEGGMGAVYRARQISLDRIVAIKILPEGLADAPEEVERFKREARAAAILSHYGIVQVHEAGEQDGIFYFVMEFVDGRSVGEWLRDETILAIDDALNIGLAVSEALGYAWDKAHIVHRDIKPDNILIDDDGTIKVADLGLMKMSGIDEDSQDSMCTPNYVSPEQAMDEDVDYRADIYSLGATLYHLVTGNMPFSEYEPEDAIDMQIDGHLQNPREINGQISIGFANVLRRMMAKDPSHRYHDWHEVATDIKRIQNRKKPLKMLHPSADSTIRTLNPNAVVPSTAEPSVAGFQGRNRRNHSPAGRSRRHKRRKKKSTGSPAGLILLLLLLFSALGLGALTLINKADEQRRRQIQQRRAPAPPVAPPQLQSPDIATVRPPVPAPSSRDDEIASIMQKLNRQAKRLKRKNIVDAISLYQDYRGPFRSETHALRLEKINELKAEANSRTNNRPSRDTGTFSLSDPIEADKPRDIDHPAAPPEQPVAVARPAVNDPPPAQGAPAPVAVPTAPAAEDVAEVKAKRALMLLLRQIGVRLTPDMEPAGIAEGVRQKKYDPRRAKIARDKIADFRRTHGDSDTAKVMSEVLSAVDEYAR